MRLKACIMTAYVSVVIVGAVVMLTLLWILLIYLPGKGDKVTQGEPNGCQSAGNQYNALSSCMYCTVYVLQVKGQLAVETQTKSSSHHCLV